MVVDGVRLKMGYLCCKSTCPTPLATFLSLCRFWCGQRLGHFGVVFVFWLCDLYAYIKVAFLGDWGDWGEFG